MSLLENKKRRRKDILPNTPAIWLLERFQTQILYDLIINDDEIVEILYNHNERIRLKHRKYRKHKN